MFSDIFETHLEEIVDAGFDVNVVAASMSVDTVGHFHRSRLFGSNQFDLNLEYGSTFTFTFLMDIMPHVHLHFIIKICISL